MGDRFVTPVYQTPKNRAEQTRGLRYLARRLGMTVSETMDDGNGFGAVVDAIFSSPEGRILAVAEFKGRKLKPEYSEIFMASAKAAGVLHWAHAFNCRAWYVVGDREQRQIGVFDFADYGKCWSEIRGREDRPNDPKAQEFMFLVPRTKFQWHPYKEADLDAQVVARPAG
jgi:hypothetical protein